MRRLLIGLMLAPLLGAAAPVIESFYPGDGAIAQAEARAKTASFACETQLKASAKAPACAHFHSAVIIALTLQAKRMAWCQTQFSSEASNIRVPDSCLGQKDMDMRISPVEELERKKAPDEWRKFDRAMGDVR